MLAPPQSLQVLLMRLCSQMLAPPQSLHLRLWQLCSHYLRALCGALTRCLCLPISKWTLASLLHSVGYPMGI